MEIIGFDFDGVFINIEDEKAKLFGEILNKYWGIKSGLAQKIWVKNLGTSRRYKFDYIYKLQYHSQLSDEQYRNIESEFSAILLKDYYPLAPLIKESIAAVRYFKDKFDLSFISSGVTDNELKANVSKYEIKDYFDIIFGTNHKYKSKDDHFSELLRNNHVDLGIFIGDGLEDMRIAKKYIFIAIGLPVNHNPRDLIKCGADIISSYTHLLGDINEVLVAGH